MTIGRQASEKVGEEARQATMPRMLNLARVLEQVDDRIDEAALVQEEPIIQEQQAVFHGGLDPREKLEALSPELLRQRT